MKMQRPDRIFKQTSNSSLPKYEHVFHKNLCSPSHGGG